MTAVTGFSRGYGRAGSMRALYMVGAMLVLAGVPLLASAAQGAPPELAQLDAGTRAAEAVRAVKRLQHSWTHYLNEGLWPDAADLLTDQATAQFGTEAANGRDGIAGTADDNGPVATGKLLGDPKRARAPPTVRGRWQSGCRSRSAPPSSRRSTARRGTLPTRRARSASTARRSTIGCASTASSTSCQ